MLIAMVSEHASPLATLGGADAGGQNVHVAALARHLAAEGHHVDVHTRRDSPDLPERVPLAHGVDVVHVDAGPPEPLPKDELLPWMPEFGDDLARRFADPAHRPDVVHAHFWMSGLAAVRAARSLAATYPLDPAAALDGAPRRLPVVQTFHALGSVKRRHQGAADTSPRGRVAAEAGLCRDADLIVATCSDEVRELQALGADTHHVRVVPCGVDLGTFTPGPDRAMQEQHNGRLRVLALGRVVERKGIGTLIEALAALPDVELLVAGGPPSEALDADPEVRRLRDVAVRHGVTDQVSFLGAVAHDDVPALLRSVDVVACTPWYEPFGIVPLEAAACGRPVVASAVGGMLDSVVHERTGLLVPPRSPEAVVDALRRLADPRLRLRLGASARIRAEHLYGWATVARGTLAAYEEVVEATKAAAGTLQGVPDPEAAETHAAAHRRRMTLGTRGGVR